MTFAVCCYIINGEMDTKIDVFRLLFWAGMETKLRLNLELETIWKSK